MISVSEPGPIPFSYSVRESKRASYLRIYVSVQAGVEVVIPVGYDRARIPAVVDEKRDWIGRSLTEMEEYRKTWGDQVPGKVPDIVWLQALGEKWRVSPRKPAKADRSSRVTVCEMPDGLLEINGDPRHNRKCLKALNKWLQKRARAHLVPLVQATAAETGLSYARVAVRGQRTRWGSCSHTGTISLNRKLLFLPADLGRMVVLHELCHTVQMKHSKAFWQLVEQFEPDWRRLENELKTGRRHVPLWAEE